MKLDRLLTVASMHKPYIAWLSIAKLSGLQVSGSSVGRMGVGGSDGGGVYGGVGVHVGAGA